MLVSIVNADALVLQHQSICIHNADSLFIILFYHIRFIKFFWKGPYFNGLVQDCSISIANALEILQSCIKPSIWRILKSFQRRKKMLSHTTNKWHCCIRSNFPAIIKLMVIEPPFFIGSSVSITDHFLQIAAVWISTSPVWFLQHHRCEKTAKKLTPQIYPIRESQMTLKVTGHLSSFLVVQFQCTELVQALACTNYNGTPLICTQHKISSLWWWLQMYWHQAIYNQVTDLLEVNDNLIWYGWALKDRDTFSVKMYFK